MTPRLLSTTRQILNFRTGVVTSIMLVGGLALAAFTKAGQPQKQHFQEIDVERLNIVEKDGTLRLAIANHDRLPDPVVGGKTYPGLRGGTAAGGAGMIFYNDEGNEDGGLIFHGKRTAQGYQASFGLTMDQYNQDEVVTLGNSDANGRHTAGFSILDRSEQSIQPFADSMMVIRSLPDGPAKTERMRRLRAMMIERGEAPSTRIAIGKDPTRNAVVVLSDPKGHARLRLVVDSLGRAGIEFLDADGHVTRRISGDDAGSSK